MRLPALTKKELAKSTKKGVPSLPVCCDVVVTWPVS